MKIKSSELTSLIKEALVTHIRESGYEPSRQELEELFSRVINEGLFDAIKAGVGAASKAFGASREQSGRTGLLKKAEVELSSMEKRVAALHTELEESGMELSPEVSAGLRNVLHDIGKAADAVSRMDASKSAKAVTDPQMEMPSGRNPSTGGRGIFSPAGGRGGLRENKLRESIRSMVRESVRKQIRRS